MVLRSLDQFKGMLSLPKTGVAKKNRWLFFVDKNVLSSVAVSEISDRFLLWQRLVFLLGLTLILTRNKPEQNPFIEQICQYLFQQFPD